MIAEFPSQLGPVSAYIAKRLGDLLDDRRVVVWYDPEKAFADLLGNLGIANCVMVSAAASLLRSRRGAEAVYRHLDDPNGGPKARKNVLIYVPHPRGSTAEQQQRDPFEGFARCGAS